jgi:hypothetical protein
MDAGGKAGHIVVAIHDRGGVGVSGLLELVELLDLLDLLELLCPAPVGSQALPWRLFATWSRLPRRPLQSRR